MRLYPPEHYDDKAHGYRRISTVPLASAMGAEIRGVNLARLDDEQFREILSALHRYKMIYFRDQDITHADQEAFTLRFGPFGTDAYSVGIEGHPNVQRLIKEASTITHWVFGDGWHTDSPFLANPPGVSLLYGKDVPPYGGDTWWSNLELAYRFLSDRMKEIIAPLRVHMSAAWVLSNILPSGGQGRYKVGEMNLSVDQQKMVEGNYHPMVRTHPGTGSKCLYVDQAYTLGIEGLTQEEADSILAYLKRHIVREEFCCRLHWEPGTFVVWDNRQCIHKAFNDYDGFRREMFRTIVEGEVPA